MKNLSGSWIFLILSTSFAFSLKSVLERNYMYSVYPTSWENARDICRRRDFCIVLFITKTNQCWIVGVNEKLFLSEKQTQAPRTRLVRIIASRIFDHENLTRVHTFGRGGNNSGKSHFIFRVISKKDGKCWWDVLPLHRTRTEQGEVNVSIGLLNYLLCSVVKL